MKKYLKRVAFLLLASTILFGCQGKKEAGEMADDMSGDMAGEGEITIRLLTDATGIDDKSFNAATWRGIVQFYGDTVENTTKRGVYYDVVTADTQDMYIPNFRQVSDEGYDLIVATGFTFADSLKQVAVEYPDQKYSIIDVDWINEPNVMEFIFSEEQGSYLVGMVAALQSQADGIEDPKFGFIGGIPGPVITRFEMGYIQGIHSVIPDAPILEYYANDWGKPELGKAQAKNWFDSGVSTIFSAAGATGNGVIAQAKESRAQGKNVWAIGVDSDQFEDGIYDGTNSAVLTSMLKLVETASKYVLEAVNDGTFESKVVRLSLADGGVGYSKKNPVLSPETLSIVDQKATEIANGDVTLYSTYSEALANGAAPEGLSARD